jgi:hypothetical protein
VRLESKPELGAEPTGQIGITITIARLATFRAFARELRIGLGPKSLPVWGQLTPATSIAARAPVSSSRILELSVLVQSDQVPWSHGPGFSSRIPYSEAVETIVVCNQKVQWDETHIRSEAPPR